MLKDISFSYRNRESGVSTPVLQGVSLACRGGELVAIQGPSGSGKSTLLYLIGGMLTPDAGSITLLNQELTQLDDPALAALRSQKIGFVFQQFHLLPRASVLENILLPASYITGLSLPEQEALKRKAREIAERLGLQDVLEKKPNQLSGGQQQRVAIARALLLDAPVILADEPTGNLDSQNSLEVLKILREEARAGKTVIVITHEAEIAALCDRMIPVRDGRVVADAEALAIAPGHQPTASTRPQAPSFSAQARLILRKLPLSLPLAWDNLQRTRVRTLLTLVGVTIGIAAVLAMLTLGSFVRDRILGSYETLGVNKVVISGYPNWDLKATDPVPAVFKAFDVERDLFPLKRIFPQIRLVSPVYSSWRDTVDYGGSEFSGARTQGVGVDYAEISNRRVAQGNWLLPSHIVNQSPVCVVGSEIAEQLFKAGSGVGEVIHITTASDSDYTCRVIGVLEPLVVNIEGQRPNQQIFIPYTFFPSVNGVWESNLRETAMQLVSGGDVIGTGNAIREFFFRKYGLSGRFRVDSDAVLVAQMEKFIRSFQVLLISIAFLSLSVGGIGIANMMLVSVSERFREIGLRKAVGATRLDIRAQFLTESILICVIAGVLGLVLGFGACELLIYLGSNVISTLEFAWVFNPTAWALSTAATLAVGVLSGLAPAIRAERLEVIEALRSE